MHSFPLLKRWPLAALATMVALTPAAWSQSLANRAEVLAHYIAESELNDEVDLLDFETDLDGDGRVEHYVSDSTSVNGKAGNSWTVYAFDGQGLVPLEEVLELRDDILALAQLETTRKPVLVSYHPGSSSDGQLHGYGFDGRTFTDLDWGRVEPSGPQNALFDQLFESTNSVAMRTQTVQAFARENQSALEAARKAHRVEAQPVSLDTPSAPENLPGTEKAPESLRSRSQNAFPAQSQPARPSSVAGTVSAVPTSASSERGIIRFPKWPLLILASLLALSLAWRMSKAKSEGRSR